MIQDTWEHYHEVSLHFLNKRLAKSSYEAVGPFCNYDIHDELENGGCSGWNGVYYYIRSKSGEYDINKIREMVHPIEVCDSEDLEFEDHEVDDEIYKTIKDYIAVFVWCTDFHFDKYYAENIASRNLKVV